MEPAQYKIANQWSKKRRFDEAMKKVLHHKWTQAKAAAYYGVSRPRLNIHIQAERRRLAEMHAAVLAGSVSGTPAAGAGLAPAVGLNEQRRVGSFEEFDQRYWGGWICPDCLCHHATPGFHKEIIAALESDATRLLVNLPPYHAKSTLVTVKHTIFETVRNPNHRTMIISKSHKFAQTFLHSIDQLLTNPELYANGPNLIKDWGPFKPDADRSVWNADSIYIAGRVTAEKDPTVQVLGAMGQVYGRRADSIKADDVATLENQRNPARVQQMLEWFDKEVSSRIGRRGKLCYVGTRVHPGDIYSTLANREGYEVLRYPLILDETNEDMLWGDHFTYEMAQTKRAEMRDADFQLVYQNIDVPGLGASFTQEMIDGCKDPDRVRGQYESGWRLIAGLDPAGGNKDSGYTAGVLIGVDLHTGKRYLIDCFNVKSLKAPQLKQQIFDWVDQYPIYAWRVENNGLQSQLVQYNEEIIRYLAQKGVRVEPHNTQKNKWDAQFGVESMAPLFSAGLMSIPWGNRPSAQTFQPLVEQLVVFPMGMVTDLAMAMWMADLGCRDIMRRAHLPMFDSRMKVPNRIRRKRVVVDFEQQKVTRVPLKDQRGPVLSGAGPRGYRRVTTGRPIAQQDVVDPPAPELTPFVNVAGNVEDTE